MTCHPGQPVTAPVRSDDDGLDHQLLEIFFDRTPMGIAVFDRDKRLQRCNKTWIGFFEHYLGVPVDYVEPGKTFEELIPGNEEALAVLIEPVLAGEVVRQSAHRLEAYGVTNYWDVVVAPIFDGGEVMGFVDIVTDATERVTAYELLQHRIAAFAKVAASMTVDQPLSATLRTLAETAAEVTTAEACAVLIVDEATQQLSVFEAAGLPPEYGEALTMSWHQGVQSPSREALETQQLSIVHDARAMGLENPLYAPLYPYLRDARWDDMVIVPLDSRGRCLGVMQYYHRTGRIHDADERSFLTALADEAALAVANAALYAASERDAALVERQRLARELHDSVSQALFSMTLHARTAERQLASAGIDADAPPSATVRRLTELTQGALAEMRALIFELRPGALAEEGLVVAVTRQAAALTAREGIAIHVTGPDEQPSLDAHVEENLYRLILEAMNNAVKHANPSCINIVVETDADALRVTVKDDGIGFDPSLPRPGHLGQVTMAERAGAIGGDLSVVSAPGAGCTVTVLLPHQPFQGSSR